MQTEATEAVDLSRETGATKEMYGMNNRQTEDFGRRCLLARRMVERGVRFIQLYSGGAHNDDNWDAHGDLVRNHTYHAGRTDQPIAALLKDLKRRGLLEETLVIWGGEFGRQPTAEYATGTGRDHNAYGFTMWMAGGGVGRHVGRRNRRAGQLRRDRPLPRQAPARDHPLSHGPRSDAAHLFLRRPRSDAWSASKARSRSASSWREAPFKHPNKKNIRRRCSGGTCSRSANEPGARAI